MTVTDSTPEDDIHEAFSIDAQYVEKVYITANDTVARVTFMEVLPNMPNEIRARCSIVVTHRNLSNLGILINQVLKSIEDQKNQQAAADNVIPLVPTPAVLN